MQKRNWISGAGVLVLAHVGSLLTSCVGGGVDGESGSGGEVARTEGEGGTEVLGTGGCRPNVGAGGGGAGRCEGTSVVGGGPNGSGGGPSPEFCGISIVSECEDGFVDVMHSTFCIKETIECPHGCRDGLVSKPQESPSASVIPRSEIEEYVCKPLSLGGAAGGGP